MSSDGEGSGSRSLWDFMKVLRSIMPDGQLRISIVHSEGGRSTAISSELESITASTRASPLVWPWHCTVHPCPQYLRTQSVPFA